MKRKLITFLYRHVFLLLWTFTPPFTVSIKKAYSKEIYVYRIFCSNLLSIKRNLSETSLQRQNWRFSAWQASFIKQSSSSQKLFWENVKDALSLDFSLIAFMRFDERVAWDVVSVYENVKYETSYNKSCIPCYDERYVTYMLGRMLLIFCCIHI